jgi:signal transduction histidine kinase/CheY-like chemotaxis protein
VTLNSDSGQPRRSREQAFANSTAAGGKNGERTDGPGRAVIVSEPDAGFGKRRQVMSLSRKAKWAIVSMLTASHPVLLLSLYSVVGDAINTVVLAGPVVATLLLGIRIGLLCVVINATSSGFAFWLLTGMTPARGVPQGLVSLLVTTTVCWGADRLRHFIEQRKAMEGALRQAQKLEAIGQLAAGVAHDMNNTLNAIMGSTFALRQELSAFGRPFQDLDNITMACDRGSQLTRNLLGFARKTCCRDEAFSLNAVVREVQSLLSRTMPRTIRLEMQLAEPSPLAIGDEAQLEHAVMNLCLNAIDAMDGHGTLSISTGAEAGQVSLRVSDTGIGMDDHVREHAFEPFFTTKPVGKGTGMGLSMVYGTVQAMGGTITLATETGAGTTITLTFPQASVDVPARLISQGIIAHPRLPEGLAVLLVDDEPMVLRSGVRMLRAMGCRVLSASNGREGLEVFRSQRDAIALVIIDLVMPDWDGVATVRDILALSPHVPVLLTSGYALDAAKLEGLFGGRQTVDFLAKPYDATALIVAAMKVLPIDDANSDRTAMA